MRVVHYLQRIRLADGGVVRATLDLCQALVFMGHDVTLVTCDATDVPAAWKAGDANSPKLVELPAPTGPLKLLTKPARQTVRDLAAAADVVHVHEFWLPTSVQVAAAARRVRTPYVISAHGMLDDWSMAQSAPKKRVFLKLVGNRMFRGAAAVHCTAEGEQQQADKWLPPRKTEVVPLVMDLTPYRSEAAMDGSDQLPVWQGDEPVVAFLGRLHEKKGIEHLISAAAMLRERGQKIRVLVAGTGDSAYEARLRAMVQEKGLAEQVQFLGLVVGDAKTALLRRADMLVLPSHQENFGLVLVEALACGTPVVTTKAVDIWPELLSSGSASIIERPGAEAVANAVGALLSDPARLERMGDAGRRWVFENFDAPRVMHRFGAMYEHATATSKARRPATTPAPVPAAASVSA